MEMMEYSRFFFALAFVVSLIWGLGWLAKRFEIDKKLQGINKKAGRMAIVDVLYIDRARKLTIVRADGREYLLLIAGESAQLIDSMEVKKNDAGHE